MRLVKFKFPSFTPHSNPLVHYVLEFPGTSPCEWKSITQSFNFPLTTPKGPEELSAGDIKLNGGNGFYCLSHHAQIQGTPSGGSTYVDVLRELS